MAFFGPWITGKFLFVRTYDVTLGLLSDDYKWLDLRSFKGQKSSAILQPEVLKLLKDHHISVKSLSNIVSLAGPGFYTGLRLSEGFCDVFKFFKIPFYSFYSHDIPLWCGVEEGVWMTKAYRGEYFFHSWNKGILKNEMVAIANLKEKFSNINSVYIHSDSALDDTVRSLIIDSVNTFDLLRNHPDVIFSRVFAQKIVRESFYFRPPEDEFKANP